NGNRHGILPGGAGPILIPAANAMDAFHLTPERADRAGVATNSAFVLKTNVAVSADQIKKAIVVEPAIEVQVEPTSKDTFRVIPTAPLATGKIYRVKLATAVTGEGGKIEGARTFSWALQTKNDFRILSTIPGDLSSRVPINTGIEFKMTMEKWQNPEKYFSITPKVAGRFETHGRTLVFVPSKPLAHGTRYTVVLKKGLQLEGSDLKLEEERKIRFETDVPPPPPIVKPTINVGEFYEIAPGKTLDLFFYNYGSNGLTTATPIEVTGYALSQAQAKHLLEARMKLPGWAWAEQNRYEAYRGLKAEEAFKLTLNIVKPDDYSSILSLPKQDRAGYYAIKLLPKDGEASWIFVQVTNVATYTVADQDQLTIWTVNADTKRPLGSVALALNGSKSQTNEQGLGTLRAPEFFKQPVDLGEETAVQIVEVGSGALQSLVAVSQSGRPMYFDYGNMTDAWNTTWGYLYLDRPLYHPQDQIEFFGLVQDRASKKGLGSVNVKLTRQSYFYDYFTGEEKVYQEQTIQADDAGRFQGKMSWDALATGNYQISIYRDNKLVTKRVFEVREFIKPAYAASMQVEAARVFAGDPVKGSVQASFFEGTPVPKLGVNLKNDFSYRYEPTNRVPTQELITDINGTAAFTIPTQPPSCVSDYLGACEQWTSPLYLEVTPKGGEEAEILASDHVELFASRALIDTDIYTTGTSATVRMTTYHVDLSKDDAQGEPWAGRNVQMDVQSYRWEAREEGTYYDFIQKLTFPRIRYEQVWDPTVTTNLVTDASGRASATFTMDRTKNYRIYFITADDQGRRISTSRWASYGWYNYDRDPYYSPNEYSYPNLHFTSVTTSNMAPSADFSLDQTAEVRMQMGTNAYDLSKTPGALFIVASRGIRKTQVQDTATFRFGFTEDLVPNAEVRAVTFDKGRFVEMVGSAFLKQEDRALQLELAPQKKAFAPGETVRVKVTAKDGHGRVIPNTKVAYGAVDKALLALTYDSPEAPLSSIYQYVGSGILFSLSSHEARSGDMTGGAEKGGGGGDASGQSARRIFKDTASFGVVSIDERGEGEIIFKAPDNITGWRLEAVGLSGGLYAGAARIDVPVTKPVFVQVVAPSRVLASDKPVIKVRAYGAALAQNTPVTFVMESPSLGVRQTVTSTGSAPVYLALSAVSAGRHTMTFRVQSSQGNDALERVMDVVATRFTKDEFVKVDAVAGASLPDIGVPEVDVYFTNAGRAMLLPEIRSLAHRSYARIDSQVASALMTQVLSREFGETAEYGASTSSFGDYQTGDGGIKLLPYASSDIELTTEVAATAPELFDRANLANYLWQELEMIGTSSSARTIQISAVSGLAALDQPVLIQLQAFADQKNLTWREQITIARGLVAAGDQERASKMLEQLLKKSEERSGVRSLKVSDDRSDDYEATAEAAALAARLHHPAADSLKKYIDSNWHLDAFPVLAQVRYIQAVLPTYKTVDASVTYKIGNGKPETLHLKDYSKSMTLTAAEAKAFQITKVDGLAQITFVRRVPGRPTNAPSVAINRFYETDKPLDQLQEGDVVTVKLRVEFDPKAQDGCYQIYDHLPGGWEAVLNRMDSDIGWWMIDSSLASGEVSFGACQYGSYPKLRERSYTARVVTRGTFTAEAPFIQHTVFTSISAIGQDQQVVVK
ncbi:hypothetical protein FJZ48_00330, partial [Candidatus Uhrbacteria bacterium]|nr:hypothetical protein [Candidatus Uhrbacteria bacterium]